MKPRLGVEISRLSSALCSQRYESAILVHSTTGWLPYVTTFYYSLAIVRSRVCAYLQAMTKRNQPLDAAPKANPLRSTVAAGTTQANKPDEIDAAALPLPCSRWSRSQPQPSFRKRPAVSCG